MYRRRAQMPDIDPQSHGGMFYDPYSPGLNVGMGLRNLAEYHFKMKEQMRQQKMQEEMAQRQMSLNERQENRLGQPPPQVDPGPVSPEGKAISDLMRQFDVDAKTAWTMYQEFKKTGRSKEDELDLHEGKAKITAKYAKPTPEPQTPALQQKLDENQRLYEAGHIGYKEKIKNHQKIIGGSSGSGSAFQSILSGITGGEEANQVEKFIRVAVGQGLFRNDHRAEKFYEEIVKRHPNLRSLEELLAAAKHYLEQGREPGQVRE